jgi:sulfur relay (sulfurtransferase) DsrF/TusC family protein
MLTTNKIVDLFDIKKRFLRSAHLERDFKDKSALYGYIMTTPAQDAFERLLVGLSPKSSQRAWRVTGDYGTGKSSFALVLAHLLYEGGGALPQDIRKGIDLRRFARKRPSLLPVLVTGTRAPIGKSLRLALARALEEQCRRGKPPQLISQLRSHDERIEVEDGSQDIRLLEDTTRYLRHSGKADGIVIILDELGKFLEFAASHPNRQDIYILQMLAEAASRSADTPIFVVGLLHQGFHAYAEQLTLATQKEWEKVAGRFEEILFNQPLEQTASIVANALSIKRDRLPQGTTELLEKEMAKVLELGWYGIATIRERLLSMSPNLFPMHPTVIPVLVKLFSRFGQNERSLFSFLLSNEPAALQSFAQLPAKADNLYRLHHLYDYASKAFGYRLALQTYRSHWDQIESVVESFPQDQALELQILKTVAILNLVDSPQLLATEDAIAIAVDSSLKGSVTKVRLSIRALKSNKGILYYRGPAGGYCLWPHTSVNLERVYQDARDIVSVPQQVSPLICEKLETRPLVARRHYIETGNLRHFNVHFVPVAEMQNAVMMQANADGQVIVILCETEIERTVAIDFATSKAMINQRAVLTAVPQPLYGLANLVAEVQRWEWVLGNVPELNHDNYALEEATRQLAASRQVLAKRLRSYVGLRQFAETLGLNWFYCGQAVELDTGRALLEKISTICDNLYPSAPKILNELVNRHELSSAAAAARLRLIERLLRQSAEPYLGMDPNTKPPEMSMYLSVLQEARLHQDGVGGWIACVPEEGDDICRVRPVMLQMQEVLEGAKGRRVKVAELIAVMKSQPYGVREGLCSLLLAVFAVIHEQDVAFYDQGSFMKQVTGQDFNRLIKAPENFEVQYCRIAGVRTAVFKQLFKVLNPNKIPESIDVLDVVRPLCVFAAQLSDFAKKTTWVSRMAAQVRDALMQAEEPATLLFKTLPEACGCKPFEANAAPSPQKVKEFVERMRESIEELRAAYPQLLQKIRVEIQNCLNHPGNIDIVRAGLAHSANRVLAFVKEPRQKAFCLRLSDQGLEDEQWIEAMGSFLCSKPPSKWFDNDFSTFEDELHRCARQFFRVESTLFGEGTEPAGSYAMRVSITCQDGSEVDKVVRLSDGELKKITSLEDKISSVLSEDSRLGLIAAARAIMTQLHEVVEEDGRPINGMIPKPKLKVDNGHQ